MCLAISPGSQATTDNALRGSDLIGKQRNRRCALRAHEDHVRIDYANTSPDANVYLGSGASSRDIRYYDNPACPAWVHAVGVRQRRSREWISKLFASEIEEDTGLKKILKKLPISRIDKQIESSIYWLEMLSLLSKLRYVLHRREKKCDRAGGLVTRSRQVT